MIQALKGYIRGGEQFCGGWRWKGKQVSQKSKKERISANNQQCIITHGANGR